MKSEWREYLLGEIYNFSSGLSKNSREFGFGKPFLSFKTVFNNYILPEELPDLVNSNTDEQERCSIMKGDVFLTRTSETLNELGMSSVALRDYPEATFNGFTKRLRPKGKQIYPLYVAYYMRSPYFRANINSMASMTTRASLNNDILSRLPIQVPTFEEQKKIGDILYSFDKKIKLNHRINDNLYAQMRTLTKQWITENSSDYELLPLAKIASINPDTYSLKEEWEYVNYLDTSSITDGYIAEIQHITLSTEKLPSRARRKIAPNDVVFSTVRPNQRHFGILSEPMPNMLGSTGFAVIRSNNPLVCNELIYLCLTENEFIEKMQQLAEQSTSTFPSIKPSDLGVCEIPCPKDDASKSFFEMLKSMFALIAENQRENISLATTRDTLLPKLMSGDLDVSSIQI